MGLFTFYQASWSCGSVSLGQFALGVQYVQGTLLQFMRANETLCLQKEPLRGDLKQNPHSDRKGSTGLASLDMF